MIKVNLTPEEVKALHHLGVKSASDAWASYNEAQHFLRTNLDVLGRIVRVSSKMDYDSKAYKFMKTGIPITNALCNHEQSRTNFWTHHEKSLEYCCYIGERMNFLVDHQDDEELVKKFYPIYMEDMTKYMGFILLELNNWFAETTWQDLHFRKES